MVLSTSFAELALVPLDVTQALTLHSLIQANRHHLTALGDYTDLVSTALAELERQLATKSSLRYGIMLDGDLIGRVDLVPVDPPRYSLGYWLAEGATGRGYATAAVAALIEYARTELRASEIFAGVSHGNCRSIAMLHRLGFRPVQDFERYTRYHRTLVR